MTRSEIKEWCKANGIEFIPEDWGQRDPETGEGLENDPYLPSRRDEKTYSLSGADELQGAELALRRGGGHVSLHLWPERGDADEDTVEVLDDFFEPYLSLLPRTQGNVLRQYMGERRTYGELGGHHSSAQERVERALRRLIRLVAEDDPNCPAPGGGRGNRRDFDGEVAAAHRVLDRYWQRRFGVSFF